MMARGFPSTAPTLFQRGFDPGAQTGGLGLHWCANSMLAMEGKFELVSDGKDGRGDPTLVPRSWRSRAGWRLEAGKKGA